MSERAPMRIVREVLRLKFEQRLSIRAIAAAIEQSHGWVSNTLRRLDAAGVRWPLDPQVTDTELERRVFGGTESPPIEAYVPIDLASVHVEKRRPGVTLELLWHEYVEAVALTAPSKRAYSYSRFCELYSDYLATVSPSMRMVHAAGDKMFVDYSGRRLSIVESLSGEVIDVELYVAVLGASNLMYAEATRSQKLGDFVGATVRALEFFGGAPRAIVPDQLRSAVSKPARHMPEINATFARMAAHYHCAVIPARPYRPRDKAKVEVSVQIAQRWIVARLRNRRFFSLAELNRAIRELLDDANNRPMRKLGISRRALFEQHERSVLTPLPSTRFELIEHKFDVGVGIDYCIEFDHRRYTVPRTLVQRRVDVHATASTIEVFHQGVRVASHVRSYGSHGTTIVDPQHRPPSHREYGEWPPERLESWARTYGEAVFAVVSHQLRVEAHPELRYRSCLALLSLKKKYSVERLNAACAHALSLKSPSYQTVKSLLKHGLDQRPLPASAPASRSVESARENVRGPAYFDRDETTIH